MIPLLSQNYNTAQKWTQDRAVRMRPGMEKAGGLERSMVNIELPRLEVFWFCNWELENNGEIKIP